jgi:uncharacterized protein
MDELEVFLRSDAVPEHCMGLSALDGFMTAVLLCPQPLMPSQWMPLVWDPEEGARAPAYADLKQAQRVLELMMRYYNGVAEGLAAGTFIALMYEMETNDGERFLDAISWSGGFMLGLNAFADAWGDLIERQELFAPMRQLGTEEGVEALYRKKDPIAALRDAYAVIPAAVLKLYALTRGVPPERKRREGPKVGRNDPCPCGSGKKYKKCCGGEALH